MSTSKPPGTPTGRMMFWVLLAVAGAVVWVLLLNGADPTRAWRSLLINFLFFTPLAAGLVVWPAVVRTCDGHWHARVERLAAAGLPFCIPSILALVVLWLGSPSWAPWASGHFHQGAWLDNSFLFGRDLAVLVLFWALAGFYLRKRRNDLARFFGAVFVLVYCLAFSLLGFDLVMALDPGWHSNLAGGYFFISGLYIAITCWGLLASCHRDSEEDDRHDIGKLIVAFSLMTTYLMYAHLLPFWYENLPREIRFLVPRMHNHGWRGISYLLLVVVYFGPLILLLGERLKRNRGSLGVICFLVLAGMWLERWWLVAPTFDPAVRLGLTELSLAAAFTGLLGLSMDLFHRYVPEPYLRLQENEKKE